MVGTSGLAGAPALAVAETAEEGMTSERITLVDGTSVEILRSPKMTDVQWQETKTYLQNNPSETKKLIEHSTNPDRIRKQKMMRAIADVWQGQIDDSNQDFAKRMKDLEQEPEFEELFKAVKDYQVQQIRQYLDDSELMQKISAKMGGPRAGEAALGESAQDAAGEPGYRIILPAFFVDQNRSRMLESLHSSLCRRLVCPGAVMDRELSSKPMSFPEICSLQLRLVVGYAVGADRMPITQLLVEAGRDLNCVDKAENSSLHYAAGYGRQEILEYLLSQKANVNKENSSRRLIRQSSWNLDLRPAISSASSDINLGDCK
ncbi:AKR2A [Symbiodinium sp. CCMP2592]|nr:AKR2A [Symbiodinium sp. CCMP2592]